MLKKRRKQRSLGTAFVVDVEQRGQGTGRACGNGDARLATVVGRALGGTHGGYTQTTSSHSVAESIGRAISDALDPTKAPGKVRTFAEMSPEVQAEMRARYEKKG